MPGLSVDKFIEICAIIASARGFGFKNRNFGTFYSGKEAPKPRWAGIVMDAA
jgi:hypothetical protein